MKRPVEHYVVHNLNYPEHVGADTPVEETVPASMEPQGLFVMGDDGACRFDFHTGVPVKESVRTDQDCMAAGTISLGVLDFSRIGR
jgi:hypothetical protein